MATLKNLIFIEDDKLDFEVCSSILRKELPHINILQLEDIEEEFFSTYRPENTLILLDINLDGMSGLDLYHSKIKDTGYTTYIHTSSDNPHDIINTKEKGISGYFQKKIGKEEIKEQLLTIVNFYNYNHVKSLNSDITF